MTVQPYSISKPLLREFVLDFPCFANLTSRQLDEFITYLHPVCFQAKQNIVREGDVVDSVYFIIDGHAEIIHQDKGMKHASEVPIALLKPGECIGLNETGFYSSTGLRTATIKALTDMVLARLDVQDLYHFLKKHQLEAAMSLTAEHMLRMLLIKRSLPFSQLSRERLQWLTDHVEACQVKAKEVIFQQGEPGDRCYLIQSGQVEMLAQDEKNQWRRICLLNPPALFGEATLITHLPRNATAVAITDCELLTLRFEYLSELITSEGKVAEMLMRLMLTRSRPLRSRDILLHQRRSADARVVTILKNPANRAYFQLSDEGLYIWEHLTGKETLQEITLAVAEKFKWFAPDRVAALIAKLAEFGFIQNIPDYLVNAQSSGSKWSKQVVNFRQLLAKHMAFSDINDWLTKMYHRYVHYCFTQTGKIILSVLAFAGFVSFVACSDDVLLFFSIQHESLWLLLGLIPLSMFELILHELAHAFAVKSYGREVNYLGIGWHRLFPTACVDTSDMWLADRQPRIMVNFAGVYLDIIVAGFAALSVWFLPNPYVQGMLWLFALYTYIGAFRRLSPFHERDGYYILMDWVDKKRLRHQAVVWLVEIFPKTIREPQLVIRYWPEIVYWLACFVFLILVTRLTLMLQGFVLAVLGITPMNHYVTWIIPVLVVISSCFSLVIDVWHYYQAKLSSAE